ncbi:MAG TPA: Hpt domain-containing protein, partial [Sphingorhabdus sp.]|nr:Hpt domain-containing protein [Sphingorhabdus sp.]
MDELREEFIAETRETLEILASQLVQWEKNPGDLSLIDSAFRFVHTVKGSCGFLDLPRLLKLSHAAEELLSAARDERITVSDAMVSSVLAVIDRISALTEALESGEPVFDNDAELIDAMLGFLPVEGGAEATEIAFASLDKQALQEMADEAVNASKARSVRVSLALLDKLMNGVSDLVLARNEVSRQLRRVGATTEIEHAFGRLSSTVAEMRDAIGMMRMQHIDRLFSSLPRLLRDICIELGKQIELTVEGSEVEVDREMVEALRDPLTHILRNSADHGIESPEQRRAAGKDPVGHIHVLARQSGNQIL